MRGHRISFLLIAALCLVSCVTSGMAQTRRHISDIRERLLKSARRLDKDFPDGKDVLLTHFSYVGKLRTQEGDIYVVNMRSVLNHMPAPRGMNYILFFDGQYKLLGKQRYSASMPLWCEEGRLYLFGDLDEASDKGQGNVIDLTSGYKGMKIYHRKRYGSSGGFDDQ